MGNTQCISSIANDLETDLIKLAQKRYNKKGQSHTTNAHSILLSPIVLPNVEFPSEWSNPFLSENVADPSLEYLATVFEFTLQGNANYLSKKSKTDFSSLFQLQDVYVNKFLVDKYHATNGLPDNYKYFGSQDIKSIFERFLRTNPFFTSALTYNSEEKVFEIISTLSTESSTSFYTRIVGTMNSNYKRINAKLDSNLQIISIDGKLLQDIPEADRNILIAQLAFLVLFYVECTHALIHIFQYIMVVGIVDATAHKLEHRAWAYSYVENVMAANRELNAALLSPNGALILNGELSERSGLLSVMRDMLCLFGSFKSSKEFIDFFLFANINKKKNGSTVAKDAKILDAFLQQADLIESFSNDLLNAFNKADEKSLLKTNANIKSFFSKVGNTESSLYDVSKVDNLKTWIDLMSITGLIHGTTLSFSRFIITTPILACIDPQTSPLANFDNNAIKWAETVTTTMLGMAEERTVFNNLYAGYTLTYPTVRSVLNVYFEKTNDLKERFYAFLKQNENEFNEFGWIDTDYCPTFTDGKMLTISVFF